jgi:hypothetical protein
VPPLRILQGGGNSRATLPLVTHEAVDGIEADVWVQGGEVFVHPSHPMAPLPFAARRGAPRRTEQDRVEIVEVLATVDGRARLVLNLRTTGGDAASDLARVLYPLPDRSHLVLTCESWAVADRLRAWLPDTRVCTLLATERALRRYIQGRMAGTTPELSVVVPASMLHSPTEVESLRRRADFVVVRDAETPERARAFAEWGVDVVIGRSLDVLAAVS